MWRTRHPGTFRMTSEAPFFGFTQTSWTAVGQEGEGGAEC